MVKKRLKIVMNEDLIRNIVFIRTFLAFAIEVITSVVKSEAHFFLDFFETNRVFFSIGTDDPSDFSASQESLYDDTSEFDLPSPDEFARNMGLGKGKPYSASKIAKKRLGYSIGMPGRPKGTGKGLPGKVGLMKRSRLNDFARKRGPKAKMRGVFGVPGVGLQRPVADGKNEDEFGVENRLVLFSARDKFVFTQDICVMCGALGTDQEGCLISCVQCGQCYHPYCINVKVTKVILQKGWR